MSAASNSEDRHMGGWSTNMLIPLPTCHITWRTVFSSVFPESWGAEAVFCLFFILFFVCFYCENFWVSSKNSRKTNWKTVEKQLKNVTMSIPNDIEVIARIEEACNAVRSGKLPHLTHNYYNTPYTYNTYCALHFYGPSWSPRRLLHRTLHVRAQAAFGIWKFDVTLTWRPFQSPETIAFDDREASVSFHNCTIKK